MKWFAQLLGIDFGVGATKLHQELSAREEFGRQLRAAVEVSKTPREFTQRLFTMRRHFGDSYSQKFVTSTAWPHFREKIAATAESTRTYSNRPRGGFCI